MRLAAAAGLSAWLPAVGAAADLSPPNVILIVADDLGHGDLGCYGQRLIRTPRLDRMAAEGTRFTHCYAGAAVCAPSRCVLMTGRHMGHARIRGNSGRAGGVPDEITGTGHRIPLEDEDVTVAEVLRHAGYATAATGKWGLGEDGTSGMPTRQGFDAWYGHLNQNHAEFVFPEYLWRDDRREPIPANAGGGRAAYAHDLFTECALAFIRRQGTRPFFLYLPYTIPHEPFEVPCLEPYADADWPEPSRAFAAMITRLDRDVGRILDLVDDSGLASRTLVLFTSDNGSPGRGGGIFKSNGGLRGGKGTLHEGGLRVPMIARWPGRIPAGRVSDDPWYFADVLPTLADLAGAAAPAGIDGVSVAAAIQGAPQDLGGRVMFWENPVPRFEQAARHGRWKAVRLDPARSPALYDVVADPAEEHDLAADHPDVVAGLAAAMEAAHVESPCWPDSPRPGSPRPKRK